jgi:bla regulator protein BlaR1
MSRWDSFVSLWWTWIVHSSWQLAVLICLAAALTRILRFAPARLRHCIWLLILIKVFLPPNLSHPFAIGQWGIGPLWQSIHQNADSFSDSKQRADAQLADETTALSDEEGKDVDPTTPSNRKRVNCWPQTLFLVWSAGCFTYFIWIIANHVAVNRWLHESTPIDEGPTRIALERIALKLDVKRVPDLMTTETISSPCLVGVIHPCIVLPRSLLETLNEQDLAAILTHELMHWRHGDTLIGWIQVVAQGLFWFHPFIWWADSELRHERECVCDEASLRVGTMDPENWTRK